MSHTVGETTTDYVWDVAAGLPVVLQDSDGNTYVYGLDLISATDGEGAQTYFQYDGLGSVTDLTDSAGNSVDSYSFDVFGTIRTQSGSSPHYWLFTGEQRDGDSGLYYLRARYYDPSTGRFVTQDPIPSLNRYPYVGNNPVNAIDPYGLFCIGPEEVCEKVEDAIEAVDSFASSPVGEAVLCPPGAVFTPGGMLGCGVVAAANTPETVELLANSYYDLNVTVGCGDVASFGVQVSWDDGFHPYSGVGTGCPVASGSFTMAPNQSITPGLNCGAQLSYDFPTPLGVGVGPTAQGGAAAPAYGEGTTFVPFAEVGISIGVPFFSHSETCNVVP
jgi:RHS repeat-associated protein